MQFLKGAFASERASKQTAQRQQFRWGLIGIVLVLLVTQGSVTANGQQSPALVGVAPFNAKVPVENGFINTANGALHLEIPLGSFPERNGKDFKAVLMYDSNIWQLQDAYWEPVNVPDGYGDYDLGNEYEGEGWRLVTSASKGRLYYTANYYYCTWNPTHTQYVTHIDYTGFYWVAPDGTVFPFPYKYATGSDTYLTRQGFTTPCGSSGSVASSDQADPFGSGYHLFLTNYTTPAVFAPDGTNLTATEDSNGNYSSSSGGPYTPSVLTDSLGRNLITRSTSGNNIYYDVLNSQGTTSRYTITTESIPVWTFYGGNDYKGSIVVVESIELPDNTTYSFQYDTGTTQGHYGMLTSMTLPTGGTVTYSYSYSTFLGSRVVNTRTTPDSSTPWKYQFTAKLTTLTTTITKPSGDNEVYTSTPIDIGKVSTVIMVPSEIQYYNGAISTADLVATQTRAYGTSQPIPTSETTTLPLPGGTTVNETTQFTWDGGGTAGSIVYHQLLKKQEWNFYTGSLPATADRTTTYTYLGGTGYLNSSTYIVDRPTNVTVTNSSGATVSQTLDCYDYSGGCGGSSFANAGTITNHDPNYSPSYTSRGDLTQTQRLTSGSSYLTKSMTYDTAGQLLSQTDWTNLSTHVTTYSYTDEFYTDGGDGSNPNSYNAGTATDAYPTTTTYPTVNGVTLTEKFGYYWGTGQKALSTDANNNTTYFHFYDSLSRPTSKRLPNSYNGSCCGWNFTQYAASGRQLDTGIGITSTTESAGCTGTSGGCRHDETQLDTMGRVQYQILVSDPDGSDTVSTTYDSNGRAKSVSNPYRTLSSPTDGAETYTYDGLDRKLTVTQADNQVLYTYYGASVGTYGGLSTQKCPNVGYPTLTIDEAKHLRETWTDGFGRLVEVDEPNASGSLSSGISTCYSYDANNNLTAVNQGSGSVTRSFAYDDLSRLTAATNPESGTINYSYTSSGSPCSGDPSEICVRTDARNITTSFVYDALNRIAAKFYSDGTWPAYYYYDQTGYSNSLGRLNAMDTYNPGAGVWVSAAWFNYDPVGNVTAQTAWVNNVYESSYYNYNLDSSISSITYPSSRQVNYLTSNAQRTTMAYDSSNTYAQGPSSGCPFNQSNGKGWACYAPPGELEALQNSAKLLTTSFYNNRLQPCRFAVNTGTTAPSSCTDSSHFGDKFDVQYSFDLSTLGSQLCSLTYGSYTNNGNVASITNNMSGMNGRSQEFCYDALNRITSAQTTSTYSTNSQTCWAEAYGIDAFGNLSSITPITSNGNGSYVGCTQESGFSTTITSGTNQDTASCYDVAGNKAGSNPGSCSPLPTTYTYDAENRLISYAPAGESYTYDVEGKRVEKNSSAGGTLYWYDRAGNVLAETTTSGTDVNEYVFFGGKRIARVDSSGNVFYYFADQLGTSRVNVQDGTTPTLCYDGDFYPYGVERPPYTNTCSQTYKFTGKERDSESGLDNFGARYGSSQYGRFMTPDWSGKPEGIPYAQLGDPQSLNLYSYVGNKPLYRPDPDGHCALCADIQELISEGMDSSDALADANAEAAKSAMSGISTMLTSMMAPMSAQTSTPFNPAVTYDNSLSGGNLAADQSKMGGAIGIINSNWSKLSDQEKTTIGGIASINVSGSAQRSYVLENTGKLTLTQDYVSKSSTAWLASAIAHDGEHVALFKLDGIGASRGIPAEVKAMQFQLQVGVKFGLSAFEVKYLQDLIQNPSQLQRYINTPP